MARTNSGAHHIEAFLELMAAERGAAAATLDAYARDLRDGKITQTVARDIYGQ